ASHWRRLSAPARSARAASSSASCVSNRRYETAAPRGELPGGPLGSSASDGAIPALWAPLLHHRGCGAPYMPGLDGGVPGRPGVLAVDGSCPSIRIGAVAKV